MTKHLTLDAIASRFPEHAIEVSRAGDTGEPPHLWRAVWCRRSGYRPSSHAGTTQDAALRAMLSAELESAKGYAERARTELAQCEEHLREREAVITELLRLPAPEDG